MFKKNKKYNVKLEIKSGEATYKRNFNVALKTHAFYILEQKEKKMKKYFLYINNVAFDKQEIKKIYVSIDTNLTTNTGEQKNCIYITINESTLSYNKLKVDYLKQTNIKIYEFIKILDKLNIFALILSEVTKIFCLNEEQNTIISNNEIEEIINKTIFKYASLINNEL